MKSRGSPYFSTVATRSPRSLKRTVRMSLPVIFLISSRRMLSVTEDTREKATPWRLARPVRPMRWIYYSFSSGTS